MHLIPHKVIERLVREDVIATRENVTIDLEIQQYSCPSRLWDVMLVLPGPPSQASASCHSGRYPVVAAVQ
jgi:hypothetical protein